METLSDIQKILVPVDYSDCSLLASRYALKVAHVAGAEVVFFHAFYSPAYDLIELTGNKITQKKLREEVTHKLLETESVKMDDFIKSLQDHKEYRQFDTSRLIKKIIPGLAKDEIQKEAHLYEPDFVIMGTRGKDKRQNSILGSITEIMIKKLKYPILAIPENYTFIGEENLNNLLFLTDYDESDFMSIKKLMGFAELLSLNIFCLHVGAKPDKWDRMKMNGLKGYFSANYQHTQVDCDLLEPQGNFLSSIDQYIQERKINLISLTTRKRNMIEKVFKPSITKRLFYHSNVPLLVFHS